jgi:hypothetical protein
METRKDQIVRESRYLRSFQLKADEIAHLIVNTDLPWADINIRIGRLRAEAERLFPLKLDLFDMIYARRFKRLWAQWHGDRNA